MSQSVWFRNSEVATFDPVTSIAPLRVPALKISNFAPPRMPLMAFVPPVTLAVFWISTETSAPAPVDCAEIPLVLPSTSALAVMVVVPSSVLVLMPSPAALLIALVLVTPMKPVPVLLASTPVVPMVVMTPPGAMTVTDASAEVA